MMPPQATLLLSTQQIRALVDELANEIVAPGRPKPTVMVPILSGAYFFGAELFRVLKHKGLDLELLPIIAKRDDCGKVNYKPFTIETDQRVLIVDTICDSGMTANAISQAMMIRGIRNPDFCFLIARDKSNIKRPCFVGHDMKGAAGYLFGYGLDRNGKFRGLPTIWSEPASPDVPESLMASQDKG